MNKIAINIFMAVFAIISIVVVGLCGFKAFNKNLVGDIPSENDIKEQILEDYSEEYGITEEDIKSVKKDSVKGEEVKDKRSFGATAKIKCSTDTCKKEYAVAYDYELKNGEWITKDTPDLPQPETTWEFAKTKWSVIHDGQQYNVEFPSVKKALVNVGEIEGQEESGPENGTFEGGLLSGESNDISDEIGTTEATGQDSKSVNVEKDKKEARKKTKKKAGKKEGKTDDADKDSPEEMTENNTEFQDLNNLTDEETEEVKATEETEVHDEETEEAKEPEVIEVQLKKDDNESGYSGNVTLNDSDYTLCVSDKDVKLVEKNEDKNEIVLKKEK